MSQVGAQGHRDNNGDSKSESDKLALKMDSKMDNGQLTLANRKLPSTKENLNLK